MDFMAQGRLTEADTATTWLGAIPFGLGMVEVGTG